MGGGGAKYKKKSKEKNPCKGRLREKNIHAQRVAHKKQCSCIRKKYSCKGNVNVKKNRAARKFPTPPPPFSFDWSHETEAINNLSKHAKKFSQTVTKKLVQVHVALQTFAQIQLETTILNIVTIRSIHIHVKIHETNIGTRV